jgi:outer membrane protein TolC
MKKTTLFLFFFFSFSVFAQAQTDSLRITLQKAIEIALTENPSMRIAERTIETKKYYKKEQIVSLFPSVSAGVSYQRTIQKQKMDMSKMMETLGPILALLDTNPAHKGGGGPMEVGSYNTLALSANLTLPIIAPALWQALKLS